MKEALKIVLKSIREKIDAGLHSDAFDLIKCELAKGTENYTLFLLAGYESYILRDLPKAVEFYRRAIDLDENIPRAWQGLLNVYDDAEWTEFDDEFAITTIDHLLEQPSNLEKMPFYKKVKIKFLIRSLKFDALPDDWITETVDSRTAINALLRLDITGKSVAQQVGIILLDCIQMSDCIDETEHAVVWKFVNLFRSADESFKWVIDHLRKFSTQCQHTTITSAALAKLKSDLFTGDSLDDELISLCSGLLKEISRDVLERLYKQDWHGIHELLLKLDFDDIFANDLLFAVVLYVYRQLGQFYRISTVLKDRCEQYQSSKILFLKLEADFLIAEDINDYIAVLHQFDELERNEEAIAQCPDSLKCARVLSQILANRIVTSTELQTTLDLVFATANKDLMLFIKHFSTAMLYYHTFTVSTSANSSNTELLNSGRDELRYASQLIGTSSSLPLVICNLIALNAKILMSCGQTQLAMTQLANAAPKQPYVAENFRLLANCLLNTGVIQKARLCAERAQLLNPCSEQMAKLLFEIYKRIDPDNTALMEKVFSDLLERRPNSKWALRQSTFYDLNEGRFEIAIEKIQRLVRINTTKAISEMEKMELCTLWIYLSEAYRQCGNLQSAVRACKAVIELFPDHHTALIQLFQLYQGMGQYVSALEIGEMLLLRADNFSDSLRQYIKLLFAQALVLHTADDDQLVSEQHELLARLFKLLRELTNSDVLGDSTLLQSIVIKTLDILLSYNSKHFAKCVADFQLFDEFWQISSHETAVKRKLRCLTRIIQKNSESSNTWNEMANSLLLLYDITKDSKILDRCITCARKALILTRSKFKISHFYCTLGRVHVLKSDVRTAQHYFIRAIQLDKRNGSAWCFLGSIYIQCGLFEEAYLALSEAQKIDPHMMAAWCGQAMHAEAAADSDTMDLYRHTIFLRPNCMAVKKYCFFLMKHLRSGKQRDDGTMLEFADIRDLLYKCELDDNFLQCMALLAEQFGYYGEAKELIESVKNQETPGFRHNLNRILIRNLDEETLNQTGDHKCLDALRTLYKMPNSCLFQVLKEHPTMGKLFAAIEQQNSNELFAVYRSEFYPLIAAACIIFGLTISQELFGIVENVRPLHKLVDVYPLTGICRSEFFTLQQQDEEEKILVRHDNLSEELYHVLSTMAEKEESPSG